jgi:hypothetical protein
MAILTIPIFYVALSILTKKEPAIPSSGDRVQIRWFVGLEIDSDLKQIAVLEDVAAEFNTAQDEIELVLDIATIDGAYDTNIFIAQQSQQYPTVTPQSWHVLVQSLAHPDNPSADQYLPNRNEAFNRLQIFGDLLVNTEDLDFDAEFQKLQDDLTRIYNK